jgi:hypothetical protein
MPRKSECFQILAVFLFLATTSAVLAQTLRIAPGSPLRTSSGAHSSKLVDVNADGKLDVVSFNSGANNIQIFLGVGDGSFVEAPGSPITGLSFPMDGDFADFDGDGNIDIAVANSQPGPGGNGVTVLLGDGTGRFIPAPGGPYAAGGQVRGIAAGDFNNDGIADIAATVSNADGVMVLLGDGTGRFTERAGGKIPTVAASPLLIFATDFNEDGNRDLVLTTSSEIVLLAGDGYGNFTRSTVQPPGGPASALIPRDMNRDGHIDLVTTQASSPGTVSVLLGDGTGRFTPAPGTPVTVGSVPLSATVADFNGDRIPDVIVANANDHNFSLLLGDGTGRLTAAPGSPFPAGDHIPIDVHSGDLNGDRIPDLLFADFSTYRLVAMLNSSPAFTFTPRSLSFYGQVGGAAKSIPVALTASANSPAVTLTITADQPWLTVNPSTGNTNAVPPTVTVTATPGALPSGPHTAMLTVSAPGFVSSTIQVSFSLANPVLSMSPAPGSPINAPSTAPKRPIAADYNGDGHLDFAVPNNGRGNLSLYLGDGTGQFTAAPGSPYGSGANPDTGASADLNGDGLPDLVVSNFSSNNVRLFFGQSTGGFRVGSTIPVGKQPAGLAIGDVNLDGILDIVVGNYGSQDVTVLLGNGSGGYTPSSASPIPNVPNYSLDLVDINGDGIPDIIAPDRVNNVVNVLLGDGLGGFTPWVTLSSGGGFTTEAAVADFNQDGWPDIAAVAASSSRVSIWLNDHTGHFTPAPKSPISVGGGPRWLDVGDINGDGIVDIGVSGTASSNNLKFLLGNGDGTFTLSPVTFSVGSNLSGMAFGDFNGDGVTDLAVSSYSSNFISVLLGSLIPTEVTLTTTVNPPVPSGTPVPLTATVTVPQPGFYTVPPPTGSVAFLDGATVLSTVPLVSGSASYTIPSLAPGNHSLTAQYTGDTNYLPETSEPLTVEATGPPAQVIATGGSPQTISVGTPFPAPLQAQVTDSLGNPLPGQTVTFTPQPGVGGASATLSATSAVTDASGIATVTATANTVAGAYSVVATVTGVTGGASFNLTNVPAAAASITAAPGTNPQLGVVNTALAFPLEVIVQDRYGNGVPGLAVTYTAPGNGPSLLPSAPAATTAADGSAQVTGTRNTLAGAFAVSAAVTGLAPLGFSLTNLPDMPASLTVVAGSPQTTQILKAFPAAIQVQAKDRYGNATPNQAVTITTPNSGASANLSPASGVTDATGTFATTATANNKVGAYTVTFAVGAPPVRAAVSLTNSPGAPAVMVRSPGSSPQSALISTAFAQPLQVAVTDAGGNPVPGVTIVFSAPLSGATASLSALSVMTNAAGQAAVTATANSTAGTYLVSATAGTLTAAFVLTNTPGEPDNVTALPGSTPQSATVGTAFGNAVVAVVRDFSNNPVPNVGVLFEAPFAGARAYLSSTQAITDASGRAGVTAVAGTIAGSYVVTATPDPSDVDAVPLSFNLTNVAGTAATVSASSGSVQSAQVSTAFANPLSALVTGPLGNPVPGVLVSFSVPTSGATATLSAASATTDANGVASITATAGATAGSYFVTASAAGASPAAFALENLTGPPNQILINSGDGQSVPVGTPFTPLQVTLLDPSGKPVSGATVTFTVPASGASAVVSPVSGTTNAMGQVSVAATANSKAGLYAVIVTADNIQAPASFLLQNLPGPQVTLAMLDRYSLSTEVGKAFDELVATVTDVDGNPVPNITVTFSAPTSGASASLPASGVSDINGIVTADAVANATAGTYPVIASAGAANTTFTLTNTPGGPNVSAATSGTPQSATIGTGFAQPLVVTARDGSHNLLSGATVTFTAPATGASATLSAPTAVTNASGQAQITVTANNTAGAYFVTATVAAGVKPATWALTNNPGVPASIVVATGGTQSQQVANGFLAPLVAQVLDAGGNPVPGATVNFTAPGSGASAVLSASSTVSDANGLVTVVAIGNGTTGSYNVAAIVSGVSTPANFSLTNLVGAPHNIAVVSGTPQSATVGSAFTPLVVLVTDFTGNPVPGVVVSFTAPSKGASAAVSATATTGNNGQATVTPIANTVAGAYTVTASAVGTTGPVSFSLTNNPGPPAVITITDGIDESASEMTAYAIPLTARITDAYGNPVPGVTVNYGAPGSGPSVTLSSATVTTDSTGQAKVTATANGTAGGFTVTASVTGAAPASFHLTNTVLAGGAVQAIAGTPQTAPILSDFSAKLVVHVVDSNGNNIPRAIVTFGAPGTGPSAVLSATKVEADSMGIASVTGTANIVLGGPYTVTASVAGLTPAQFALTNTVGEAVNIAIVSGTPQNAGVLTTFAQPLVIKVTDSGGNPVPNFTVVFIVPPSGASAVLSATTLTTDATGQASVTAMANSIPGTYTVIAALPDGDIAVSFGLTNGTGPPRNLAVLSGTAQTTAVGSAFAPLVVLVTDAAGNPVPGVAVSFVAPSSGASATVSATATTGLNGRATVSAYANNVAGSYLVTASVAGISGPVAFSLTNTPGPPASLTILSGTPQSATVSMAFTFPLVVKATDAVGNPVSGATITFTAPGNGPSAALSARTVVTDDGGSAYVMAVANTIAGTYNVVAASPIPGVAPRPFTLTNTPGPPTNVKAASGTPQTAAVGKQFANALQVVVTDAFGNPIPGAVVAFSAPATGASAVLSAATATTSAAGIASVTATANKESGSYQVFATASGLAPAVFALTNTAGPPGWISAISGTPQTTALSMAFAAPLQVQVFDISGNPVSGATVTFTSPGSGASAILSSTTATTDQSGTASVTATANGTAGSYAVTASAAGVAGAVSFALTNTSGTPITLSAASGYGQKATVAAAFTSPLTVRFVDASGNPVSGVAVTFVAPATGPSAILSSTNVATGSIRTGSVVTRARRPTRFTVTVATDSTGTASVTATANGIPGSYVVAATAWGVASPAMFRLTNTAGPPAILFVQSGAPQAAAVSSPFSVPLSATVTDLGGNPLSGVTVTFSAPSSGAGAVLSSTTALTDAQGDATVKAMANSTAGAYQVTASVTGVASNAKFSLTNTSGTPPSLRLIAGTSQTAIVLTTFATPLTVKLIDAAGNPVSRAAVAFYGPAGGSAAILSRSSDLTNASGEVSITAQANGLPGTYLVYAAAGGAAAPVAFSLTNVAGTPVNVSVLSGSHQAAALGSAFASPLTVKVADGAGNGIAGAAVTFSVPATRASASLSTNTVTTDGAGMAAVDAIASSSAGNYEVHAGIAGAPGPAIFQLTNLDGQSLVPSPASISLSGITGVSQTISAPLTVVATGGAPSFTAVSSASWLNVTPSSASAPTTLTVTANTAGLGSGTYSGNVVLASANGVSVSVPVALTLGAPPRLLASPAGLAFEMNAGGPAPSPQQLSVASIDGTFPFTVAATVTGTGPNWLTLTTLSATSSSTAILVSASPGGYLSGTYQGTISITPAATNGVSPLIIPVSFSVLGSGPPAGGSIQSVTNAASFSGAAAPGSLATIFGTNLSTGTTTAVGVPLPFALGGVTVTVGGKQAAMLYVSSVQINFQVPVDVPPGDMQVVVNNNGVATPPFPLHSPASAPGIFLVAGTAHAAAQNPDYTANSPSQPAAAGQYVTLYLTGTGLTTPPVASGQGGPSDPFSLTGPIDVTIGGVPAQVLYSGLAPNLVGSIQVNVAIPLALTPGEYAVAVASGNAESNVATVSVGPPEP